LAHPTDRVNLLIIGEIIPPFTFSKKLLKLPVLSVDIALTSLGSKPKPSTRPAR